MRDGVRGERRLTRWLAQFEKTGANQLQARGKVGGEIHGLAGSTLSARAVSGGVRRSLALYGILVDGGRPDVAARGAAAAGPTGGGR